MSESSEKISFLKLLFGPGDVSRDLVNITVKCPNTTCSSRLTGKRKFSIRVDTDQSQCWVCGLKTHDSLIPVLRKFFDAEIVKEYVSKYQSKTSTYNHTGEEGVKIHTLDFPNDFRPLVLDQDTNRPDVKWVKRYAAARGLTERDMWYFKLGTSQLTKFKRRIIVPSFDSEGFVNFYSARVTDSSARGSKYLVPDTERVSVIFNEVNIDWKSELTIVEGPFDLFKCDDNATCLQGSGLSEDYLLFWKIVQNKTPILLAMDADAKMKSHKIAKLLTSYDIDVRILDLEQFSDVGEMKKSDFVRLKCTAKEWSSKESMLTKISNMRSISTDALLRNTFSNRKQINNA